MIKILTDQKSQFNAGFSSLKIMSYSPTKNVFIKPNIGSSSMIANTDPYFVAGMIKYIQSVDSSISITVADGSVKTSVDTTLDNFEKHGWSEMCSRSEVSLLNLNKVESPITLAKNREYINVAKMKTHMQTTVSLCSKNQKGLLSPDERKLFHQNGLHDKILLLSSKISPIISIVEGIIGIEGNGPGEFGKPREDNLVIVGTDMNEVDTVSAKIMGFNPYDIKHIHATYIPDDLVLPKIRPYTPPDNKFSAFNLSIYTGCACSSCISSVGEMCRLIKSGRNVKAMAWFARHGVLSKTDIRLGKQDSTQHNTNTVFYGNCASVGLSPDCKQIHGCPPDPDAALKKLVE